MPTYKSTWKSQLLNDEQYSATTRARTTHQWAVYSKLAWRATRPQGVARSYHSKLAMTPQLLNAEQYNPSSSHISGNLYKLAWKTQLRFRSHTTQRRVVCSRRSVLEVPRMDARSRPDGEPRDEIKYFYLSWTRGSFDYNHQECTEHAFTGVNSKLAWRAVRCTKHGFTGVNSKLAWRATRLQSIMHRRAQQNKT
jgi:hypothetical protein